MKTRIKIILGLIVIGIIAALLVYFYVYNKPHTDYEKAETDYRMSAIELYNEYANNKAIGDSLYTGRVIEIAGPLSGMETIGTMVVAVFVFSDGIFGEEGIRCTMLPKFHEMIKLKGDGDEVKIKGYCTGYNETDVILEHCSIIN